MPHQVHSTDIAMSNSPNPQDSLNVWHSLRSTDAETPPPEEVQEGFFNGALVQPLTRVCPSEAPLVAVIGVGYVGEHLVTTFSSKFNVLAFDVSKQRLESLAKVLTSPSITLTSNASDLAAATHFLVSVPTTLLPNKQVDTSHIRAALATVSTYARPGATVVIESSVAVGMTRKLLQKLMISRQLKAGMSPERVDPGRIEPPVSSIPKIISGLDDITPDSLSSIQSLYSRVFDRVVPVSSPEVAEMTKLYENCQRMICIAYVNEMSDACEAHGISPFEVASAASTKPFGYLPFTPSLGVGGHCIPVNPYYLLTNNEFPLLQDAAERMWARPGKVADKAIRTLFARRGNEGVSKAWPEVLVVGVGFKPGQSVLSCSPGVAMMKHILQQWDVKVTFADPLVAETAVPFAPKLDEKDWTLQGLRKFDLIIVAIRQTGLDFGVLEELDDVQVKWCCA
ncbi:putative udp-glucose dehydrogenase udp-mannac protein [Botryosphaeria dothidea]|uniref:Udp-glucose dehydrogenase udp-mannac protein n=1 Tax=Botryosphaeria dothidea TaxID=55169 RepID=A0A8H4IJU0_9PEZI|nr:putative udp-glucose dehydrogenase udp-mannac protein [Botryosphaeria dothidea]